MRNIRSVEDQFHSIEQVYNHFIFICPADDMGHLEFSSSLGYLRMSFCLYTCPTQNSLSDRLSDHQTVRQQRGWQPQPTVAVWNHSCVTRPTAVRLTVTQINDIHWIFWYISERKNWTCTNPPTNLLNHFFLINRVGFWGFSLLSCFAECVTACCFSHFIRWAYLFLFWHYSWH